MCRTALGFSGLNNTNKIFSLDLNAVSANSTGLVNYKEIVPATSLENINGTTRIMKAHLLES